MKREVAEDAENPGGDITAERDGYVLITLRRDAGCEAVKLLALLD